VVATVVDAELIVVGVGLRFIDASVLLVIRNSLSVFSSVTAPQDCSVDAHRVSSTRTPTKGSQHM
jgi:hypothetical protein